MKRSRGFSLISMLAFMTFLAGSMLAVQWSGRSSQQVSVQLSKSMGFERLDDALRVYLVTYGRLPCPSTTRNGPENCDNKQQKGWIPIQTLTEVAGVLPIADADQLAEYRYMVRRGSEDSTLKTGNPDIAAVTDVYKPYYKGKDERQEDNSLNDMCEKLERPAFKPLVAYGLAAAGSNGFSGKNANDVFEMEAPSREQDENYSEAVHVVTGQNLSEMLRCEFVLASMETLEKANRELDDAVNTRKVELEGWDIAANLQWRIVRANTAFVTAGATGAFSIIGADGKISMDRILSDGLLCTASFGLYFPACVTAAVEPGLMALKEAQLVSAVAGALAAVVDAGFDFIAFLKYSFYAEALRLYVFTDKREELISIIDKLGSVNNISGENKND